MPSLREKLIVILETSNAELDGDLQGDTPLIKSGRLDSLGLFNLALFVESESGREVDITAYDLSKEWNTIDDLLNFITRLKASG